MLKVFRRDKGIIRVFNPNLAERIASRPIVVRVFVRFIELVCRPFTTFAGLGIAGGFAATAVAAGPVVGTAIAGTAAIVRLSTAAVIAASETRIIEPSPWTIKEFKLHYKNGSWESPGDIMAEVFAREDLLVISDPSKYNNHVFRHVYGEPACLDCDQKELVHAESKWEMQMLVLRNLSRREVHSPTASLRLFRAFEGELYTDKQPPAFVDRPTGAMRFESSDITMDFHGLTYKMYRAGGGSPYPARLTGCAAGHLAGAEGMGHSWCNAIYGCETGNCQPKLKVLDPRTVLAGMLVWFQNVSEFRVTVDHFSTLEDMHKLKDTDDIEKEEALERQTHLGRVGFQNGTGKRHGWLIPRAMSPHTIVAMHGARHGTFLEKIIWC